MSGKSFCVAPPPGRAPGIRVFGRRLTASPDSSAKPGKSLSRLGMLLRASSSARASARASALGTGSARTSLVGTGSTLEPRTDPQRPHGFVHRRSDGFAKKYTLGVLLGEGSFGKVFAVQFHSSKIAEPLDAYAAKVVDFRDDVGLLRKAVKREAALWSSLGLHENVVRLQDVFLCETSCYLVMERCAGSLREALDRVAPAGDVCAFATTVRDMLSGVAHVHQLGIVHRDLKPANFLVAGGRVKLADFGLAARLPEHGLLEESCGTAPFMAPEMLHGSGYDCKADVWSLAVTVYYMLYRELPYQGASGQRSEEAVKRSILQGWEPPFAPAAGLELPAVRPEQERLVRILMCRNPALRCSAERALTLPLVASA